MSEVKVNKISPRTACGTVTLGDSGDTIALGSGASQTGFGRTGTVDWDTSIKTGTVTAVTGKGYFVDTTSGAITVNLPAAAVGSIVAVSDYASTAASNNITISPNGSEKINAVNDDYTMDTAGLAVTLVYADATRGWKSVTGSDADATGVVDTYIAATGGNQPTASGCIVCTNYKIHKFTGPGTFCVSAANGPIAIADYMVVAGGGSGGVNQGGGGGGGGFRESSGAASGCYSASPLGAGVSSLAITVQGYPIVVGGGAAGKTQPVTIGSDSKGVAGVNSSFSTITSAGGGAGGGGLSPVSYDAGGSGGSGGGGGNFWPSAGVGAAGSGNTPPVSPAQGKDGGLGDHDALTMAIGGGGGGATVAGTAAPAPNAPTVSPPATAGPGGTGVTTSISATPTAYAGGGGGGNHNAANPNAPATGGTGGGGAGGTAPPAPGIRPGGAGTVNTGGGGGAAGGENPTGGDGGAGGSGIVIIRYKFQ